jgi:hypothetical protein
MLPQVATRTGTPMPRKLSVAFAHHHRARHLAGADEDDRGLPEAATTDFEIAPTGAPAR